MHVTVRQAGEVVLVGLEGRLVGGIGDEILREVMNELIAEGWKKVLLDLSSVSVLDSAGIGELVASLRLCHKFDVSLRLLIVAGRVKESLHLAALLPAFRVYPSEKDALRAFGVTAEPEPARRTGSRSPAPPR